MSEGLLSQLAAHGQADTAAIEEYVKGRVKDLTIKIGHYARFGRKFQHGVISVSRGYVYDAAHAELWDRICEEVRKQLSATFAGATFVVRPDIVTQNQWEPARDLTRAMGVTHVDINIEATWASE